MALYLTGLLRCTRNDELKVNTFVLRNGKRYVKEQSDAASRVWDGNQNKHFSGVYIHVNCLRLVADNKKTQNLYFWGRET